MAINYKKIVKSPYFWLFALAVANLLIALFFVRYPLELNGDSPSYLGAMQIIQGQDYDHNLYGGETEKMLKTRILTTPLMLYFSIAAGQFLGGGYAGMFFINLIFYFLIILVFYELVKAIYQSHKVALIASVLFFANYCFTNYGPTYRTDIGGWFFFLLTALLAVNYFKTRQKKFFWLAILASSVGVLFKEYGALGLTTLGILILFLPLTPWQKIKELIKTAILFSIIPVLYYIFVYLKFGFSYIDRYLYAVDATILNTADPGINWSIILLIKVLGWLFLAGWPIFAYGLYQEYKNFDLKRFKILLALLPASIAFLAWPGLTQRIAFIFVPLLSMVSAFGLSKLKNKYVIILILIAYAAVGYLIRNSFLPWDLLKVINF
ncbi:MAG: glycosyltransferase family 39 protein [Candidatus Buchananbacteria bacterium]|nr:glycosyltransferase family 39 protein [Candidatus Buchananbacteria bacterium]